MALWPLVVLCPREITAPSKNFEADDGLGGAGHAAARAAGTAHPPSLPRRAWGGAGSRWVRAVAHPPGPGRCKAIVVVERCLAFPPVAAGRRLFPASSCLRHVATSGRTGWSRPSSSRPAFDTLHASGRHDWSSDDRLALLLDGAEHTGAELIGCQAIR